MPKQPTEPGDAGAKILTSVPGLDEVLGRGYPPNRVTLIEGPPGSGKSVAAQQGFGSNRSVTNLSYPSDAVILFRQFEAQGEVRKSIAVLKKRYRAFENTLRELQLAPQTVRVGLPLAKFRGVLSNSPVFVGRTGRSGPLLWEE